jgi:predicted transcriptional regulator
MKVKELMVKNVITLRTDTSSLEATKLLNRNKIGCLVVVRDDDIEGILTERDLLQRFWRNRGIRRKQRFQK